MKGCKDAEFEKGGLMKGCQTSKRVTLNPLGRLMKGCQTSKRVAVNPLFFDSLSIVIILNKYQFFNASTQRKVFALLQARITLHNGTPIVIQSGTASGVTSARNGVVYTTRY